VNPRDIARNRQQKFWFNCDKCNHEFETTAARIKEDKANCVYCASLAMCYDDNCNYCYYCYYCYDKSFITNEKSKCWSNKNKVTPRHVFKSSDSKYIFNCDRCNNEFRMSLSSVTRGNWCPSCVNKTERKLRDWLFEKYGEPNVKFQHVVIYQNHKYIYDFYIGKFNSVIELDGLQHFKQVGSWKSPEHNLENDVNKIHLAYKNKYSVIHLLQEDVLYDKNNWKNKLFEHIKQYEKFSCIFIDNNEIYKNHIDAVDKKMQIIKV
jgi:hypothetical protein